MVVDAFSKRVGRAESKEHKVSSAIKVGDTDLKKGEEYKFMVKIDHGPGGREQIGSFVAKVHSNSGAFTIPTDFIKENGIKPGQTLKFEAENYTEKNSKNKSENMMFEGEVLDRVTPNSDSSKSDELSSSLNSRKAHRYVRQNSNVVKVRNVSTGDEVVMETMAYDEENSTNSRISFPKKYREEIGASPGDLIEIIAVDDHDTKDNEALREQIDEIHEMVQELYDAYKEAK